VPHDATSYTRSIRDAKGRRPDDPNYDPRTLHVPPAWFKDAKVTEAQQQWWRFKAANFGSVLLFKVGKFYEVRRLVEWLFVRGCEWV
jgi:DNA mismatch repair protein MSH6